MTIRKGEDWGLAAPLTEDGVIVGSDAEAGAVIRRHLLDHRTVPPLGLTGGDLWKALGAPRGGVQRLRGPDARTFPIDLGSAEVDGRTYWFMAHLVARNSWWRGRLIAVMNGEFLDAWRVVPRAHPNDGRLDIVDADPSFGQRWLARTRLRTGEHLPHPDMKVSRSAAVSFEFDRPLHIRVDGVDAGRASALSIQLEPDALTVVV